MELDKALKFAVILAWEDLMKVTSPCSAQVEYRCEPGTSLDYLNVWSVDAEGRQNRVCEYWTGTSPAHPSGVRFSNRFHSDQLGLALDFILMNQGQFTRRVDASRDGLALIYPPTGDERTEAATWMRGVHGAPTNISRPGDERVATL
ncbi:MAG: hypothetical protein ABSH52_24285 [Terriglobia bacterium]|jgi:hypothetical protein